MSTWDTYELAPVPPDGWRRELWLQHVAGFILLRDVRDEARARLDPDLSDEARAAAEAAIDDTVYRFMMVADGVVGSVHNDDHQVSVRIGVELADREHSTVLRHLDLFEGDGACMGIHGWLAGDFGEIEVARPR